MLEIITATPFLYQKQVTQLHIYLETNLPESHLVINVGEVPNIANFIVQIAQVPIKAVQ